MKNKRLQSIVTAGRWTLPVVILVCLLCRALTCFLASDAIASTPAKQTVSILVYAVIGYILIEMNNRFSIIRTRATAQTSIYFLLVTACPQMHLLYAGDFVALLSLLSICFLLESYLQEQAAGCLFYSFFFIGAGSILFPQLSVLAVLWLFEASRFRSLAPRSFCGALLGWILPCWMLFGYAFFFGRMELFCRPFRQLLTFCRPFDLTVLQPWEQAMLGYLLVMFIVSAVHFAVAEFEDKIRTRAYFRFLIGLTLFLFLLIALQPAHCSALLPLLMICSSILTGHFYVLTGTKVTNVLFVISLSSLIPLFAFNLWTLL